MIPWIAWAALGAVVGAGICATYIDHIVPFVNKVASDLRRRGIISLGMQTFIEKVGNLFKSIVVNYYKEMDNRGNEQMYEETTRRPCSASELPSQYNPPQHNDLYETTELLTKELNL